MKKLVIDSQAVAWTAAAKELASKMPEYLSLEITPGSLPSHCGWESSDGSWGHIYEDGTVTQFCPIKNGHVDIAQL